MRVECYERMSMYVNMCIANRYTRVAEAYTRGSSAPCSVPKAARRCSCGQTRGMLRCDLSGTQCPTG
jgi:hypothetical protein